jgi:beta-galactosidase
MSGFGHPMFRNVAHPFPATPPTVPKSYNPVGSYRRSFNVPEGWAGRQVFLHFEGVQSASTVWVNGREVTRERPGTGRVRRPRTSGRGETIAVRVLRWSGALREDRTRGASPGSTATST